MKDVLVSIELQMLKRTDYVRDCKVLGGYMFKATEPCQYPAFGMASGWAHSLLSSAFTAQ